jgi:hypothetical protein
MNTTVVVMNALLNPVITDPTRQQLDMHVNTEVYPLKWDEATKTLGCIVRFCSFFDIPEHLLWHRDEMVRALGELRQVQTKIANSRVREHRVGCGLYEMYVDLEVHYFQNFPSFPSPEFVDEIKAEA